MEDNRSRREGAARHLIHIDIGMVIFFIILVYMVFSVAVYVTSRRTDIYEVRMGTLSEDTSFRGIALRQEKLVDSRYSGRINYYNTETDRVRAGGLAYSVDAEGEISDYADADMAAGDYFTEDDLRSFRDRAVRFVENYQNARFYAVYDFKSACASQAQKISNRSILAGIRDLDSTSIHTVKAAESGSIVYSYDNYTGKTFAGLTQKDFDPSQCKKTQLRNGDKIVEGSPAYRVVTDENWSVAIMADSKEAADQLANEEYVEVRFLKNNTTSWASVESREGEDGQWYVNLRFSNSMESFCTDRFVDIELLSNEQKGLKVPNSSITDGDFFLVPKEYVFEGSNGQQGVLLRVYTGNGSSGTQFVPAVPYSETKDEYYLDNSVLRDGEILQHPDSTEQFTLGKKEKLIGVYYINKGYPDFRQVTVNMQNSEYSIVEPNELYGLQEYDYVVLHADSIKRLVCQIH